MASFSSDRDAEFTTFDGLAVSQDPPHGASVVVLSHAPQGWVYLVLHRAHRGADYEGDWAWTPPSGARLPGEDVVECARRELEEETGLRGSPRPLAVEGVAWAVFELEVDWGTEVVVDGVEHDRWEWVTFDDAYLRCLPEVVAESLRMASR